MTTKILLSICCLVIVFGVVFVAKYHDSRPKVYQTAGAVPSNIVKPNVNIITSVKYPIRNVNSTNPEINAEAVYLVDTESMQPLLAKNEREKLPIASLTKIAGAIVVLEDHPDSLNDVVSVPKQATGITGDKIGLKYGESISVENLLSGLLVMSGNDAAYTLSEHFGGNEQFVLAMNAKAKKIGLSDTNFLDPAGLDDEGCSTAFDLAVLTNYALKNKQFAEIVKTPEKTISSTNGNIVHVLRNSNRLLVQNDPSYLAEAIGVKTGFTSPSGHVMVSAAHKNNHTIISVVLHTDEHTIKASAKESKKLLQWSFTNWSWQS